MRLNPAKRAKEILSESNIQGPPIDLMVLCKSYGIVLKSVDIPDDISGMLQRTEKAGAAIFVNDKHSDNRKRFTIAHELGHFFLNHTKGIHVDKSIIFRNEDSSKALYNTEIEANKFAAELLMPSDLIRDSVNRRSRAGVYDDDLIDQLAIEFSVSATAMSYRLQNLGIKF
jgi:Zn-dependent peptidase ImmA (M78 family)